MKSYPNVNVYLLKNIRPKKKHFRLSIYVNLIKKLKPDIIIVHFCGYDRFHAAILSGIKPIAGVLMGGEVNTHSCATPLSTFIDFYFTKLFLPYVELLASKTNLIVNMLEKLNLKGKNVHVPWGVKINDELRIQNLELKYENEEDRKNKLRSELGLPLDKFIILSNRNVAEPGRQLEIVKGYHKLIEKRTDLHLVIIVRASIGVYLQTIINYIKINKLEKYITIINCLPQEEMMIYYKVCDVMVSNWIHDGMPQSFFEASLRGMPIVMNELIQYRDYYENRISAMMNDGSSEGIARNLEELISNSVLRNTISENGIKIIKEKANFDKWSEFFISEMLEIINNNKQINIPKSKLFTGRVLILLIWFLRRWPFSSINVKV
ncbi:MAG: glycosyltransferase [Ignavibacteriae bacterium]|nr:glycosyltransferase [Ignavibacteriota bacterium]